MDDIEQAIDEELSKINPDISENESESEDDNCAELDEDLHTDHLSPSLLAYINASKTRISAFQQLICEDVEGHDFCSPGNQINESCMSFTEDQKRKDRVMVVCETEKHVQESQILETSLNDVQTEQDVETDLQFSVEWRELEKRLKEEEEQKLAAQQLEREQNLNSEREDEERRRRSLMEFEEQLRKTEEIILFQNVGSDEGLCRADLQWELNKQQEFIQQLEKELEEEKQAFEEAQEQERRGTQELQCKAATKIQAAVRGALVRRWSKTELKRKREEEKKREEERREWEKMKKEREEERRRTEEEKRMHREEMERRRQEYERAKENERHRLEEEKRREQQKKKEEMRRKEEQNNQMFEEERRAKEERREEQRRKEKEDEERRREMEEEQNNVFSMEERQEETRGQEEDVERECKEKERREETEIKEEMKERKYNNETIRVDNKEKNISKKERNKMENIYKSINVERSDDQKRQTMRNKDRSCQEEKRGDSTGELHSSVVFLQENKNLKVTRTTSESCTKTCQEPSNDQTIKLSDVTQGKDSDESLNAVEPEMDTRGYQNVTAIEPQNCTPEIQESGFMCLPDSTEQKRLAWMRNCTPWSKLSLKNKQKRASAQQQSQKRRSRVPVLPPLPMETILKTGAWRSLEQVTTVTLEDLPGCSLFTLSQCRSLQTLTLNRCGLRSLDGLHQCSQIRYIDVQENSITHVDCGGLANLQVLLLGRNQLRNIQGLDDAKNLHVLQLSHNSISHISGLGSLKMLQELSVDHNQLLSTRGLNDIYTLLHLDCSHNHLSRVVGLENCVLLNTLDLRGNSLTELPVLHNHVLLRDLLLDDNLISSIRDLESYWLPLLQNLSLAHNSITDLIPLMDLVSLKSLDVGQNCLSDPRDVCVNLQGCISLQQLNLNDNPLLQEKSWRSLLLETVPGLIKLNHEQTPATSAPPKGAEQRWSFQALCESQQRRRDSLLLRHETQISSALSQHEVHLLACGHHAEIFRLAVDQRYSHEYGDSCVTEDLTSSSAAHSRQHDLTEASLRQSPKNTADSQKIHHELQTDFSGSCTETQTEKKPFQTLNLKTVAAVLIQRCWRRYTLRRCLQGSTGLIAKTNERTNIRRMENSCAERPEPPESDGAAVVIQAAWRGFSLRRKLTLALAAAQITGSDEELEEFEEVDIDEFIFDEKAVERDWMTLRSAVSPVGAIPHSPRPPVPKSLLKSSDTLSVFPLEPKHAWADSEDVVKMMEQSVSPHLSSRGITSDITAHLMLKRANKMKGRKQQQKRLLGCRAENEVVTAQKPGETQKYRQRSFYTPSLHPHKPAAVSQRDHFLPVINRDVLNGGPVQLVASHESGDKFRVDTVSSPTPNKQIRARRHSAEHTKIEAPSPIRTSSAPTRKERISFRDGPVRHSGGWGGGKKRTKPNK